MSVPLVRPVLALFMLAAMAASAQPARSDPVVDSSFRALNGERVMEMAVEVPASLDAVWQAFTTAEGFESWAVKRARVDLRVGGEFETSYDPKAQFGAPGNIRNRIEALVPQRLLVIRNVQAPPVTAFDVPTFQTLQTVIHFHPLSDRLTRVVLQSPGFGEGDKFESVWRHFQMGNRWTLAKLRERFEPSTNR